MGLPHHSFILCSSKKFYYVIFLIVSSLLILFVCSPFLDFLLLRWQNFSINALMFGLFSTFYQYFGGKLDGRFVDVNFPVFFWTSIFSFAVTILTFKNSFFFFLKFSYFKCILFDCMNVYFLLFFLKLLIVKKLFWLMFPVLSVSSKFLNSVFCVCFSL